MSNEENVNIDGQEGHEFDESQIPEDVLKNIKKEARQGYIPKDRFDSAIGNLKDEIGNLKTQVETKAPPAQEAPKYTRAQLRSAVDNGTINEDQMDEIWANQVKKEAIDEARKESKSAAAVTTETSKVASTLSAYGESIEGLTDPGSDNNVLAEEAYAEIVALHGQPTTQLENKSSKH